LDDDKFADWVVARRLPPGLLPGRSTVIARWKRHYWRPVRKLLFEAVMWGMGQYQTGIDQALDVRLAPLLVPVPDLDPTLDGLTILHLSDLHLDSLAGIREAIQDAVRGVAPDLCLLTGDYAAHYRRNSAAVVEGLKQILEGVKPKHGVYLSLGNYDSVHLAKAIRAETEWRLLINESVRLSHGGAVITLLGLDDPFEQAHEPMVRALTGGGQGFRIVLSHTPDLAAAAAAAGHDLYLCGHTHGGQICLPNGRPMIVNTARPDLACGLWREGNMWGYTTRGAGVSGIPRRHNCPPEVALLTLVAGNRADM
jgi:predicted MPP superfamily phosphohydrolase